MNTERLMSDLFDATGRNPTFDMCVAYAGYYHEETGDQIAVYMPTPYSLYVSNH